MQAIKKRGKGDGMDIVGVIPARYASVRFPGKALALLQGRPLILHTLDQVLRTETLSHIIVATDDERIARVVREVGGEAVLTSDACQTGSDRVAEVARDQTWDLVVNIQGDEPRIDPEAIDQMVRELLDAPDCGVGSAMVRIHDEADFRSPHVVKALADSHGRAIYFSRSPLPSPDRLTPAEIDAPGFFWGMKHLGLYVYRRSVLMDFAAWPQTPLEKRERLEQLRLLENGVKIRLAEVRHDSIGVDTPEELEQLNLALARGE